MPFSVTDSEQVNSRLLEVHGSRSRNGEVWLNGEINNNVIEWIAMRMLNQIDSGKYKHLTLYINSPGGFVHETLGLIDVISSFPIPVRTVVVGSASSAAVDLFLAGDERIVLPHSWLMVHSLSDRMLGKVSDLEAQTAACKAVDEQRAAWYASRTKKTAKFWSTKFKESDFFFNAEEAVNLGIATRVADDFNDLFGDAEVPQEA